MQTRKLIINMFKNGDQILFRVSWFNLYVSTHFSLFFIFFFIITIANSFVERGVKVASAAVVQVVVVNKILRSGYTLNGVSHAVVTKSRADPEPIMRYSIRKSLATIN